MSVEETNQNEWGLLSSALANHCDAMRVGAVNYWSDNGHLIRHAWIFTKWFYWLMAFRALFIAEYWEYFLCCMLVEDDRGHHCTQKNPSLGLRDTSKGQKSGLSRNCTF